jgi:hypothetical protein
LPRINLSVHRTLARLLPLLLVLLLSLLAGLPLFRGRVLRGHDALFYPPRLTTFYQGLSEGQLLPRWTQEFAGGFGEPYYNFNAPLLYYLAAVFQSFGLGQIHALNLALFVLLLASGLAMYFLAAEFYGTGGGLVAACAYLFAPFTLLDLYVRGSYAEFSGIPFIPLTLWLLYKGEGAQRIGFTLAAAVAFACMLLTNNTISLMGTPILGLFILFQGWQKKNLRPLIRGAGSMILGLMLAAFFWLPSLMEKSFVQTDKLLEGDLDFRQHFAHFWQLFDSHWGYGFSLPGDKDGLSFQVGYAHLALTLAAIFTIFKLRKRDTDWRRIYLAYFFCLILLGIVFSTEASLLIWKQVKLLQYLQFPWRFLILIALGTSFLSGAVCLLVSEHRRLNMLVPALTIGLILAFNYSHAKPPGDYPQTDESFSSRNIISNHLEVSVAREFRPRWAVEEAKFPAHPILIVTNTGAQVRETSSSSTLHRFQFEGERESIMRLNIHYFPGWKIFIDGNETAVDYNNPQGLMHFLAPPGSHLIEVKYSNTPIRTAAEVISLAGGFLLLLAAYLFRKSKASNPVSEAAASSA